MDRVCLKIKKRYILAPSVLGPNLQLPAHGLISPNSFYETLGLGLKVGSLSTRVFETRTATGREHFVCHDSGVSQIFILIISNGEKILSNVTVVV